MTDQTPNQPTETVPAEDVIAVVSPTRLQKFNINHPRIARALAIGGGLVAVVGTVVVTNTAVNNRHHLRNAKTHVLEADSEFSSAVSPTSTETTDA